MLRFMKEVFAVAMTFFSCNVLNVNSLKCAKLRIKSAK